MIQNNQKKHLNFRFPSFRETIDFSDDSPLFGLVVQNASGESTTSNIKSTDFSLSAIRNEDEKMILTYEIPWGDSGNITVMVELVQDGREVVGSLQVIAKGDFVIRQVQFPYIEYSKVEVFDSLLMSSPWGDNIQRPVKTIKSYCLGKGKDWIYDYIQCGEDEVIYPYPSIMAMQYMVLHNNARSLYIASYSTADDTMTFHAKIIGKTGLALSVTHYPFLKNGEWVSPKCGFALLPGDWHTAADLYASRMQGVFSSPDLPLWMKDPANGFQGWLGIMMHLENKEPIYRFNDLPAIYQKAQEMGLNTLQIAGWANTGHDTLYPDYYINEQLGTVEELRKALDEIKAVGGHTILYTNGRLVDPDSIFFKSGGDRFVCLKEDGTAYMEKYYSTPIFRIACPSCHEYRVYLGEQIRRIVAEYGANAIQVDQISCNNADFCFDKNHPHTTPANNFLSGVTAELKHLRSIYKALDSEFFVWCEGCHERFGQYYDIEQGHGEEFTWQIGESLPEQFQYTFPERIVTGISGSCQQLIHTYCQGKPFDFYIEACNVDGFVDMVKQLSLVRKNYPAYFLHGIFRDNVGLEINSGVRAFRIDRADGKGMMINLWVPGAESMVECNALLKNPKSGAEIKGIYPGLMKVKVTCDMLEISWTGSVATLIFE